jgi:hypothetical protein
MSGTQIPNLPLTTTPARSDWTVDQQGAGPNATFKSAWSSIFGLLNIGDITGGLGYTPVNKAGDTMTGGLTLSSGSLSVASGTVNVGNSAATSTSFVLNSSTGTNSIFYQAAGVTIWEAVTGASAYSIGRFSGGVIVDAPLQILATDGSAVFANSVTIGAGIGNGGGTGGTLAIYSPTAAKGATNIKTTANSGNTSTNIVIASQAGTRTYTVPDAGGTATFVLSQGTLNPSGLANIQLGLTSSRNKDGTVITATPGSGLFSVSSTVGSTLDLIGQNAKSATITSDAIWEWATPPTYIAGQNLTVTVNAVAAGTGTNGASTIGVSAYGINNTGTFTSNIGPATQSLGTVAADYAFVITGTSLTATEKLLFDLQTKVIENGGANNLNAQINSIRVG